MKILGLSAFYHDSAAAVLDNGRIVAACQEERFTRRKFDPAFPAEAIRACLDMAGLSLRDIDLVAYHEKPHAKFDRLVRTFAAHAPRGFWAFRQAMPQWIGGRRGTRGHLLGQLRAMDPGVDFAGRLLFAEHHQSHAAAAFFASPFDEALVLTIDAVGEWATTSVCLGRGNALTPVRELHFPHSLGLLYSAVTQYLGFKVLSGEYKVMGLAPYGTPRFRNLFLERLVDLAADGSLRLDMRYFDYCVGSSMISEAFADLFGQPHRPADAPLTQFHMDVAASLQAVTEESVLRMVRALTRTYGQRNLCLAGGVALNCVANGRIWRECGLAGMWVQPAAGDAGGALGAALAAWHQHHGAQRTVSGAADSMQGAYLGPGYTAQTVADRLRAAGAVLEQAEEPALLDRTVAALADGQAVGWFQGRMEYGPRALGARSILADARSPEMQRILNLKVKNRESFRPFAPVVTEEDAAAWFDHAGPSPYMLVTAPVRAEHRLATNDSADDPLLDRLNRVRSTIPAVTHVDFSARLQTVAAASNPRLHRLLTAFKAATGCPVLVNTSFNVRGEPIVCTPEDAFRCFMGTEIDMLVAETCILQKSRQDPALVRRYADTLEPD